jgi:hypothetical protein
MSNKFTEHEARLRSGFIQRRHNLFIDGKWTDALGQGRTDVIEPATERTLTTVAAGSAEDIDRAVLAADKAFKGGMQTNSQLWNRSTAATPSPTPATAILREQSTCSGTVRDGSTRWAATCP